MSEVITLPYEPNMPEFRVPCEVCAQEFNPPLVAFLSPDTATFGVVTLRIVDRWDMPNYDNSWYRIRVRIYQGTCQKCGTMYQTWDHTNYVPDGYEDALQRAKKYRMAEW